MSTTDLSVVLAGGGTGGHVIPALAIAEEVVRRGGSARFVGTSDRIEARLVPQAGFEIDFIKARPLAGGGVTGLTLGLGSAPFSAARSIKLLRRVRPDVVIGVGGYVAGPVVLAAWLLRLPTAVLEQNATVGLANKILARVVTRAFVTYEETVAAFPGGRAEITGNPIKSSILEAAKKKPKEGGGGKVRVLVMGGSQGALAIDTRVPRAMARADLAGRVKVLHQCGADREQEVAASYREAGIEARVVDFIDDTASAYLETDLVVARAGATTISELTVIGLPAVFLPYPHHKDRQQFKNAAPMA
ncbi:MAG: undecaprenyldiphospho-muramoylpentapeptide beta-N-acetylglucosaminyltransferase, partial [Deltaproteobacteria bacterium]|nr:undecaprenyldiphospho-muramoylpentapeptide beta-N-acetylglucosaminyltransferase [Deltaproteobacteria bacterium]